jgi:hypothetical protein
MNYLYVEYVYFFVNFSSGLQIKHIKRAFEESYKKIRIAHMDNKEDNRNEISNELGQHCDNKESLKVDEQIKLQKKCTKQVKPQDSLCGSKLNMSIMRNLETYGARVLLMNSRKEFLW